MVILLVPCGSTCIAYLHVDDRMHACTSCPATCMCVACTFCTSTQEGKRGMLALCLSYITSRLLQPATYGPYFYNPIRCMPVNHVRLHVWLLCALLHWIYKGKACTSLSLYVVLITFYCIEYCAACNPSNKLYLSSYYLQVHRAEARCPPSRTGWTQQHTNKMHSQLLQRNLGSVLHERMQGCVHWQPMPTKVRRI